MKKLLSLLSVLTISGTAVPITIAASPYQKEEKINSKFNYLQINNLKTLNRNKRDVYEKNEIESKYHFLGKDEFFLSLIPNFWEEIIVLYYESLLLNCDKFYDNIEILSFLKSTLNYDEELCKVDFFSREFKNKLFNSNYERGFFAIGGTEVELVAKIIWFNWEKVNKVWEESDRTKRIRIVGSLPIISDPKSYTNTDHYSSTNIRDNEEFLINTRLDRMWQDFDGKLNEPGDINLGIIENDSNNSILKRFKELFSKLDTSQFEIIDKSKYSYFSNNSLVKINVKKDSNVYPIKSFKKSLIFISKQTFDKELEKIEKEDLIQKWNSNFDEWNNEINRQIREDFPHKSEREKRTWKGDKYNELKDKLLNLDHILVTIDNKFKIKELYKTVQGLQEEINSLKQQINALEEKINKIKYDLYDDENLEKCSKGSSFISKSAKYIPSFGTLISKAINSIGQICDLEK
ncbi:MAG: hypothetical protein EHV01_005500 [Spiroplasma sp. hy2]|uniref:hypothetical protein n=1 Tax=Spiroplasma sp. hy2 TaxID=2490850 RepID=UPI0038406A85